MSARGEDWEAEEEGEEEEEVEEVEDVEEGEVEGESDEEEDGGGEDDGGGRGGGSGRRGRGGAEKEGAEAKEEEGRGEDDEEDLEEDEDDGEQGEQLADAITLTYPKLTLRLSLQCTRSMHCYIKVKKFVVDTWYDLGDAGATESLPVKIGETINFEKEIEVQYHVAIDDYQRLSFSIYDGDFLNTTAGYFFASIEMQMRELLFGGENAFQVYRQDDHLCNLTVKVALSYDYENTVTLPTHQYGPDMSPEDISLERLKVAFFRAEAPTLSSLREATPHFWEMFGTYSFAVEAMGLLSEQTIDPTKIQADSTQVRIRFCHGHQKEPDWSPRLKVLWTSMPVMKVYDVQVLEVKISHEDLTGERDVKKNGDPDARIVVQVLVKNIGEQSNMDRSEHTVSTVSIPLSKIIALGKKTKATKSAGELRKCFIKEPLKQAKNLAKRDDPSKPVGGDDAGYDSFDEILDSMTRAEVADSPAEESDGHAQASTQAQPQQKKQIKDAFGYFVMRVKREDVSVKCESGDTVYEEKLRLKLKRELKDWIEANRKPFKMACKEQAKNIDRAQQELNLLIAGCTIYPSLVLDMHALCLQHMHYCVARHRRDLTLTLSQPTFHGSTVLDAALSIYQTFTLFNKEGSVMALAGGVLPPKPKYPSRGLSREVGLPLCQEYVLSTIDESKYVISNDNATCTWSFSAVNSGDPTENKELAALLRRIDPHDDLLACLEPRVPTMPPQWEAEASDRTRWLEIEEHKRKFTFLEKGQTDWKGDQHVNTIRYSGGIQMVRTSDATQEGLADLKQGVIEAATIYQPCVSKDMKPAEQEESTDRLFLDKQKCNKTIILASNVGSIMNNEELAVEIWGKWGDAEDGDGGNLPLSIFSTSKDLENVAKTTVKSLERLLEKASADLTEKNANVPADGEGAKASVVWILGNDQGLNLNSEAGGQSAMDHLFKIFDDHIEKNPDIALIVVLAAETRIDINEILHSTVEKNGKPFESFTQSFEKWMKKKKKFKQSKGGSFSFASKANLVIMRWVNFSEVIAQHYRDEGHVFHLLKKSDVVQILGQYMPEVNAELVVGQPQGDDEAQASHEKANDEVDEATLKKQGATIGFFARLRGEKPPAPKPSTKKDDTDPNTIEGYSELKEMKARFEKERKPLFMSELKVFLSDFIMSSRQRMGAKEDAREKNCATDCVLS